MDAGHVDPKMLISSVVTLDELPTVFEQLRGPNNEEIFFTRLAPEFNEQGVIVDPYRIEYAQIPEALTLYFDMNNYEPLFAPQGFTCEAAFPIAAP